MITALKVTNKQSVNSTNHYATRLTSVHISLPSWVLPRTMQTKSLTPRQSIGTAEYREQ